MAFAWPVELDRRLCWWMGALLLGYLLAMLGGPTRSSFYNGWRALRRYRELWLIPVLLALAYTTWQCAVRVFYFFALPAGARPEFSWWQYAGFPADRWTADLRHSLLPSAEGVAGMSVVFFATYPVSALAALMLLLNWRGLCATLREALCRRYGARGWLIWLGLLLAAVAAMAKPVAYAALPMWGREGGLTLLRISLAIDWVSFLFEGWLGLGLQTYLILLAYLWIRGRNFTREHLMEFGVRRFSVVLRWAIPLLVGSSLLIHGPHFLLTLRQPGWMPELEAGAWAAQWFRILWVIFLLGFFAVEITLVFHAESLREACRDNFRLMRRHAFPFLYFLSMAFVHFFFITALGQIAASAFGQNSLPGIVCQFGQAVFTALVGSWMLACWVCLYKEFEPGAPAHLP